LPKEGSSSQAANRLEGPTTKITANDAQAHVCAKMVAGRSPRCNYDTPPEQTIIRTLWNQAPLY
jgi:hypothetical protein